MEIKRFPLLRRMRQPVGRQRAVDVASNNEDFAFYGAASMLEGRVYTERYPKEVSEHTISFLESVLARITGRVLLVWDQARWHTSGDHSNRRPVARGETSGCRVSRAEPRPMGRGLPTISRPANSGRHSPDYWAVCSLGSFIDLHSSSRPVPWAAASQCSSTVHCPPIAVIAHQGNHVRGQRTVLRCDPTSNVRGSKAGRTLLIRGTHPPAYADIFFHTGNDIRLQIDSLCIFGLLFSLLQIKGARMDFCSDTSPE